MLVFFAIYEILTAKFKEDLFNQINYHLLKSLENQVDLF